jgi:hypothetical protein
MASGLNGGLERSENGPKTPATRKIELSTKKIELLTASVADELCIASDQVQMHRRFPLTKSFLIKTGVVEDAGTCDRRGHVVVLARNGEVLDHLRLSVGEERGQSLVLEFRRYYATTLNRVLAIATFVPEKGNACIRELPSDMGNIRELLDRIFQNECQSVNPDSSISSQDDIVIQNLLTLSEKAGTNKTPPNIQRTFDLKLLDENIAVYVVAVWDKNGNKVMSSHEMLWDARVTVAEALKHGFLQNGDIKYIALIPYSSAQRKVLFILEEDEVQCVQERITSANIPTPTNLRSPHQGGLSPRRKTYRVNKGTNLGYLHSDAD